MVSLIQQAEVGNGYEVYVYANLASKKIAYVLENIEGYHVFLDIGQLILYSVEYDETGIEISLKEAREVEDYLNKELA